MGGRCLVRTLMHAHARAERDCTAENQVSPGKLEGDSDRTYVNSKSHQKTCSPSGWKEIMSNK